MNKDENIDNTDIDSIFQHDDGLIREFNTGSTRSSDNNKYRMTRFMSASVLNRFFQYMHKNRLLPDGSLRAPDNWKKGIPIDSYVDSMGSHFFDVWRLHESVEETITRPDGEVVDIEEALCGLKFNVDGMLYEILKKKNNVSSCDKKDN